MQMVNLKSVKILGGLFTLFTAFTACKKDAVQTPAPQPVSQELVVQFSNTGVAITDIDSIVVIVRDQHNDIKKWKTLDKVSSSFRLNLRDLAAGNYHTQILAYSKKRADFTARQFALTKNIVLPLEQTAVVKAPNGNFNDSWYQRAVFFGGQDNAVIIVAMDPRDTYYEVSFKEAKWKRIHIERYSININALVAGKSNSRNIEGMLGLGEYGDFIPYVEKMNGMSWMKGSINGYIEQQNGGDIGFAYEYNNN